MSQRMIVLNSVNTVENPDGETNSGTTSTTEDKGTTNKNKRKGIANIDNRNATHIKKIGQNNPRT